MKALLSFYISFILSSWQTGGCSRFVSYLYYLLDTANSFTLFRSSNSSSVKQNEGILILLLWRLRQQVTQIYRQTPTRLHGATSQKTVIFTSQRLLISSNTQLHHTPFNHSTFNTYRRTVPTLFTSNILVLCRIVRIKEAMSTSSGNVRGSVSKSVHKKGIHSTAHEDGAEHKTYNNNCDLSCGEQVVPQLPPFYSHDLHVPNKTTAYYTLT
jgi:hypothetical protein